jgi:protocatechuate 3,4-dioxygenase beta subunit
MTRRQLLALGLSVPAAGLLAKTLRASQDLSKFTAGGAPACTDTRKLTPTADDNQFRPGSPGRTWLVEAGMDGKRFTLTGAVVGLRCGAIKDAIVEVWQADSHGVYDPTGFRLRGHQATDVNGAYTVVTIVPGPSGGQARHIGVRVHPPGKSLFTTLLFFSDDPASAKDPAAKPELIMKVTDGSAGAAATMDIVLDL